MLLLQLFACGLFAAGFFYIFCEVLRLPPARTTLVKTKNMPLLKRLYLSATAPMVATLSKRIHLEDYSQTKLQKDLTRLELDITPQQYQAAAIVAGIMTSLSALLTLPFGMPIVTLGLLVLGILVYFKESQKVEGKLEKLHESIAAEVPGFVAVVLEELKASRDLRGIISKYMDTTPNSALRPDLTRLLTQMTGNDVAALQEFRQRTNIPEMSTFIAGLTDTARGIDAGMYMNFASIEINKFAQENIKRKIAKRPRKVKKATIAMVVCMVLLLLVPLIMQLAEGFKGF